jgi:hypothetical protein
MVVGSKSSKRAGNLPSPREDAPPGDALKKKQKVLADVCDTV